MHHVIFGTGAVGGVVGARLHLAGLPVTLVARGDHLAAVRRDGLVLDAADGRHVVRAPTAGSAAEVDWSPGTVVLLAVKSQQTAAAIADLADHAPPGTPVVCLQNGVANEREVLRRFERVHAITVMLPATHLEPGVVVQGSDPVPGILDVGRAAGGTDEVDEAVSADLGRAGFVSVPRPDIMAWKHRKLLLNLGNGVDAAFVADDDADESWCAAARPRARRSWPRPASPSSAPSRTASAAATCCAGAPTPIVAAARPGRASAAAPATSRSTTSPGRSCCWVGCTGCRPPPTSRSRRPCTTSYDAGSAPARCPPGRRSPGCDAALTPVDAI